METRVLKCPECGGELQIEDGLDTFFCKYCGAKIILDGQSDAAYRAKTRVIGMKHDEEMYSKKLEHEKYIINQVFKEKEQKNRRKMVQKLLPAIGIGVFLLLSIVYFSSAKISSNIEEKKLQNIVDEVMIDIENEDFDQAYVKAQSIVYTKGWSSDIEKKWEATRREVINQIVDAEKAVNGKATHKKEKKGILDTIKDVFD